MTANREPEIEIKITGYLPISAADAEVLEYMTNIDLKAYVKLLGMKYQESDYKPVLERVRKACDKILEKQRLVRGALIPKLPGRNE